MKKIGVLLPAMRMGGAEKIFLNFLEDLKKYYNVTVILNKMEGELLKAIPEDVPVIELDVLDFKSLVRYNLSSCRLRSLLFDAFYYLKVKLKIDNEADYSRLIKQMPQCTERFDAVIAYVGNVSTQIFNLAHRFKTKTKIAWIHGETTELKDEVLYNAIFSGFDKIYTVSEVSRDHFVSKYPACKTITEVYYNRINTEDIRKKAKDSIQFDEEEYKVVTVGRLSPEKGQLMIPAIVQKIKQYVPKIKWYVVGAGPDYDKLNKEIFDRNVKDSIVLTGNQMNPYPYINMCDLYVQPSYEEGYSTTICEACILGKAIVGTVTSGGIYEQIEDKTTGFVVEPNVEALSEIILWAYNHQEDVKMMGEQNLKKDFGHSNEIEKIVRFLGV